MNKLNSLRGVKMLSKDLITTNYISIDETNVCSKLIGKFKTCKNDKVIIFNNKTPLGIFNKYKFIRIRHNSTEEKLSNYIRKVKKLDGTENLDILMNQFINSDSDYLPLIINNTLKGIVTVQSLLSQIKNKFRGVKLEEKPFVKINQFERLGKAISALKHDKVSTLPVVDDNDNLIGIVSIIDIMTNYFIFSQNGKNGKNPSKTIFDPMKTTMTDSPIINSINPTVVTAPKNSSTMKLIDQMITNDISTIILIAGKSPVGLVNWKDILTSLNDQYYHSVKQKRVRTN